MYDLSDAPFFLCLSIYRSLFAECTITAW